MATVTALLLAASTLVAAAFSPPPPRWMAAGVPAVDAGNHAPTTRTTPRTAASERIPSEIPAINDALGNSDGGVDARHRLRETTTTGRAKRALALAAVAASLAGSNPVEAAPSPPSAPSATLVAVATPAAPYTGPLVDTTDAVVVALDDGVTYRDLREGVAADGIAAEGRKVNVQWVLKRSNGYSIDASANHDGVPFIFVVGSGGAIPGLDAGIRGMAVGGIRRIVVPPSRAYVGNIDDPNAPGPVPPDFGPRQRIKRVMENRRDVPDESFLLDVKLTRVR